MSFGAENLPYGVFERAGESPRVGARYGDAVLDLAAALGEPQWFAQPSLDAFLAAGPTAWHDVRARLQDLLASGNDRALVPLAEVTLRLPFAVADYVDFYSSLDHAANAARILRGDAQYLPPNWRHLPVAYHGRAGTVVASGTPVVRPCGQWLEPGGTSPRFGPSQRLDFECEVGFVVGAPSRLGSPVGTSEFADHVFGVVLVNDWSARDLQFWESAPLGPFLGKSFATSMSTWVTPLDALACARVAPPPQDPEPLPYLLAREPWGLDLALTIEINGTVVSAPSFASMYWTAPQQLAHTTVNGASLRTGDLIASGTVSGPDRGQRGCLLELTWGGTESLTLADGSSRVWLQDGDTVTLRGSAPGPDGSRVSLGEAAGTVLPARCAT